MDWGPRGSSNCPVGKRASGRLAAVRTPLPREGTHLRLPVPASTSRRSLSPGGVCVTRPLERLAVDIYSPPGE